MSFAAQPITRTVPVIHHRSTCSTCSSLRAQDCSARQAERNLSAIRLRAHYHFPQADTAPLLAGLAFVAPILKTPRLLTLNSPQKQEAEDSKALVAWLVEEARDKGRYCCLGKILHAADPSTLECSPLFLDQAPTDSAVVALPDLFAPSSCRLGTRCRTSRRLTLSRLGLCQPRSAMVFERVTGGKLCPRW